MEYRAFVSYAGADRAWAEKLRDSLEARHVRKIFYDKRELRAGAQWPDQLGQALADSQHLVVLYSEASSNKSSFANFEHWEFSGKYHDPTPKDPARPARRMIYVLLDTLPPAHLAMLHAVSALKDKGLFSQGAAALADDDPVWVDVVDQVVRALTDDEPGLPVGCFVLAATAKDFGQVNFDGKADGRPSLNETIADLEVTRDQMLARYHGRAEDWSPFGNARSISSMLGDMKNSINARLKELTDPAMAGLQIRLQYPTPDFWKDFDKAKQEVARWRKRLVVIVVDPFSLYVQSVTRRLDALIELLPGGQATVIVLGGEAARPVNELLRKVLAIESFRLHRILCAPELPLPNPQPLGAVNVTDEHEIQRLVFTTIGMLRPDPAVPPPRADIISMAPA